ncbi:MAG: tetratricopeptide repeat protein [Clostridia bacterium]|nr:tetratricopeptide repeat protein [Clostridia bacterium]
MFRIIWYRNSFLASIVSILGCLAVVFGLFIMRTSSAAEGNGKAIILIIVGFVFIVIGYIISAAKEEGNRAAYEISRSTAYSKIADECRRKNDINGEIDALKKALSVSNDSCMTWVRLGETYVRAGNNENALKCFKKAITINAEYAQAYMCAGDVYSALNQYEEALPYMTKAVALMGTTNPKYHVLLANAAFVAGKAGDTEKMEQFLNMTEEIGYEEEAEEVRQKLAAEGHIEKSADESAEISAEDNLNE